MLATYVIFYFMTAFTLTYGTSPATVGQAEAAAEAAGKPFDPAGFVAGLGYAKNEFLTYLIIGVVFFGIFTVVSGPLAERLGRRKMLMGVTVLIAAYGLSVNALFNAGTVGVVAALIIGFTLMGLTFGPMAAYLPELFPANVRYTGSAVSYKWPVSSVPGPRRSRWSPSGRPRAERSSGAASTSSVPRSSPSSRSILRRRPRTSTSRPN